MSTAVSLIYNFQFFWQHKRITCLAVQSWSQHVAGREQSPRGSKSLPATSTSKHYRYKHFWHNRHRLCSKLPNNPTDVICTSWESKLWKRGETSWMLLKALTNSEMTRHRQCAKAAWQWRIQLAPSGALYVVTTTGQISLQISLSPTAQFHNNKSLKHHWCNSGGTLATTVQQLSATIGPYNEVYQHPRFYLQQQNTVGFPRACLPCCDSSFDLSSSKLSNQLKLFFYVSWSWLGRSSEAAAALDWPQLAFFYLVWLRWSERSR